MCCFLGSLYGSEGTNAAPHSLTITFAFPLLTTFKALKSKENGTLKPWVIYWLIVALATTIEQHLYFVFQLIPFFGLMKVYFSLWLILPQTKGAEFLYYTYVEPSISQNEERIDQLASTYKPWELLQLLAHYAGYSIGKVDASTKQPTDKVDRSYLDIFVESFTGTDSQNGITGSKTLLESLIGVVSALPSAQQDRSANDGTSAELKTPTSHPSQTSIDYDLVGKDEIASIVESVQEQIHTRGAGWVSSWWSGEKPKAA